MSKISALILICMSMMSAYMPKVSEARGLNSSSQNLCNSDEARVLIVFDSSYNHTFELAQALAEGVQNQGAYAQVLQATDPAGKFPAVTSFHGLALGSPVHYGNPTPNSLQWLVEGLAPGWGNGTFHSMPGSVFATGGGIHQGTEGTLQGLTRAMLNFGFRMVTPRVSLSGFYGSLGASAVTGTAPWKSGTELKPEGVNADWHGPPSGGPVAEVFLEVGRSLGSDLAIAAQGLLRARCTGRMNSLP